jgi:hypothetical protein
MELARKAGLLPLLDQDCFETLGTKNFTLTKKVLEQFAKLIVANNPPDSQMTWHEGYEVGAANEREACAEIASTIVTRFSIANAESAGRLVKKKILERNVELEK